MDSPGRPPRLSHSSWTMIIVAVKGFSFMTQGHSPIQVTTEVNNLTLSNLPLVGHHLKDLLHLLGVLTVLLICPSLLSTQWWILQTTHWLGNIKTRNLMSSSSAHCHFIEHTMVNFTNNTGNAKGWNLMSLSAHHNFMEHTMVNFTNKTLGNAKN